MCTEPLPLKRIPLVRVSQQEESKRALMILCGQALCLRALLLTPLLWPDSNLGNYILLSCLSHSTFTPRSFCPIVTAFTARIHKPSMAWTHSISCCLATDRHSWYEFPTLVGRCDVLIWQHKAECGEFLKKVKET